MGKRRRERGPTDEERRENGRRHPIVTQFQAFHRLSPCCNLNTDRAVAAYRPCREPRSEVRPKTLGSARPVLIGSQDSALSVLWYTPPPSVPTYKMFELYASMTTLPV